MYHREGAIDMYICTYACVYVCARQRRFDMRHVTSHKIAILLTQQSNLHWKCMAFLQRLVLAMPSAEKRRLVVIRFVLALSSKNVLNPSHYYVTGCNI